MKGELTTLVNKFISILTASMPLHVLSQIIWRTTSTLNVAKPPHLSVAKPLPPHPLQTHPMMQDTHFPFPDEHALPCKANAPGTQCSHLNTRTPLSTFGPGGLAQPRVIRFWSTNRLSHVDINGKYSCRSQILNAL